jgi:hypothetical protein
MKALLFFAALAAASASAPALAQIDVRISLGQPGFYGPIDVADYRSDYGPPPVYLLQPVIVERGYRERSAPVYLRVPPGHRKKWHKHCHKYGACGQPVLFVQDRWYADVYAPRYRERYQDRVDARRDRHDERHERRADRRDDDRGRGHDRGHKKEKRDHHD